MPEGEGNTTRTDGYQATCSGTGNLYQVDCLWQRLKFNNPIIAHSCLDALGLALASGIAALLPTQQYSGRRWLETWKYGSGGDYQQSVNL